MTRCARLLLLSIVVAGCGKDTCKPGDVQCLESSLSWSDFDSDPGSSSLAKPPQKLSDVDVGALEQRAAAAGDGGLQLAPVGAPTVSFNASDDFGGLVGLTWTDPLGCRPAFCMSTCPRGARCVGARCAPSIHDGIGHATTLHWARFEKASSDPQEFDLRVFAVSASGCPADVAAAIASGAPGLAISAPVIFHVQLNEGSSSTGGTTGGTGGSCPGGFEASTVECDPTNGCTCTGASDTCVSDSQYAGTGFSSPGACMAQGGGGCLDGASGVLVHPCCPGLRCVVSSQCGGDATVGGKCLP